MKGSIVKAISTRKQLALLSSAGMLFGRFTWVNPSALFLLLNFDKERNLLKIKISLPGGKGNLFRALYHVVGEIILAE